MAQHQSSIDNIVKINVFWHCYCCSPEAFISIILQHSCLSFSGTYLSLSLSIYLSIYLFATICIKISTKLIDILFVIYSIGHPKIMIFLKSDTLPHPHWAALKEMIDNMPLHKWDNKIFNTICLLMTLVTLCLWILRKKKEKGNELFLYKLHVCRNS